MIDHASAKSRPLRHAHAKPVQLASVLEREIRSGKVGFGERLQSESELVQRFAMSRSTVRKGLEELAGKGLITTKVGIGSFVTYDGQVIDNRLGWTRALATLDDEIGTKILRIEIVADQRLADKLGLGQAQFVAINRARFVLATGKVISLERSRVPMLPELERIPINGLEGGSLSHTLREAGLIADNGEEWAEIERLSKADAKIMKVPPGTAYLRTRRLVRNADQRIIEYVVSILDPDHFALHLEF